jgi:hypothetical protein
MRAHRWILSAALGLGLSSTAFAQTVPSPAQTPSPPVPAAAQPPAPIPDDAPRPVAASDTGISNVASHWLVSGFAGGNFDRDGNNASPDFGGQIAYLWNGVLGAELLGNVTPSFKLNNALISGNPNVNTYMANVIGAIPFGTDGRIQPYISGGLGAVQMRSDVFNVAIGGTTGFTQSNQATFGGNVGGGLMAFAGNVGIRGDLRFFHAFQDNRFSTDATAPEDQFTKNLLLGLDIWRANIGVAVRW